jgi:hypothetical protein
MLNVIIANPNGKPSAMRLKPVNFLTGRMYLNVTAQMFRIERVLPEIRTLSLSYP